jgi:hypothetical protein
MDIEILRSNVQYELDKAWRYAEECKKHGRNKEVDFTAGEIKAFRHVLNEINKLNKVAS